MHKIPWFNALILPLEEWAEGFSKFESGEAIKVVFQPGLESK